MEITDNKRIAARLDELDTLPAGYTPNLDSKWELLEASLDGQRKTKRRALVWVRAAAALLLCASLALLLPDAETKHLLRGDMRPASKPAPPPEASSGQALQSGPTAAPPLQAQKIHTPPLRPAPVPQPAEVKGTEPELAVAEPEPGVDSLPARAALAAETPPPKKKKQRYVQVDFGAPTQQRPVEQFYAKYPKL
jgi:hypothetical protein